MHVENTPKCKNQKVQKLPKITLKIFESKLMRARNGYVTINWNIRKSHNCKNIAAVVITLFQQRIDTS